jgi:sec-independent protein translocase protein TatA
MSSLLAFLGTLGTPEILIIGFLVLLLFGAKKIPEMARGMGQAIREFRKGSNEPLDDYPAPDRAEAPRPTPPSDQ